MRVGCSRRGVATGGARSPRPPTSGDLAQPVEAGAPIRCRPGWGGGRAEGAKGSCSHGGAARSIAKGKTETFYTTADPVAETASAFIKKIRAYAATSGEDNVYELARLSPPAPRTPAPPPTIPTNIVTDLTNDGSIVITWKAKNAAPGAGTAFTIHRKLAGETYTSIATSGVRRFTDDTVPPGTASVSYMIRGIRGDKVGKFSEAVTVYLGKTPMNGNQGLSLAA